MNTEKEETKTREIDRFIPKNRLSILNPIITPTFEVSENFIINTMPDEAVMYRVDWTEEDCSPWSNQYKWYASTRFLPADVIAEMGRDRLIEAGWQDIPDVGTRMEVKTALFENGKVILEGNARHPTSGEQTVGRAAYVTFDFIESQIGPEGLRRAMTSGFKGAQVFLNDESEATKLSFLNY